MQKSIKIFIQLIKLNFRSLLIYRANFFISLVATIFWTGAYIIFIEVLFLHIDQLKGFDKGTILLLMTYFYLFSTMTSIMYRENFEDFDGRMRRGEIDFALIKPVSVEVQLFFRTIRLDHVASLIVTFFMFLYAFKTMETPINILNFLLGLLYTSVSLIFFYYFLLFIITLSFWLQQAETLHTIVWNLLQVARYPRQIYTNIGKIIFVFLFPLALITSLPTEITIAFKSGEMPLYFMGVTIIFAIIARKFFYYGLKKYSSAG
ncbi:ABC-2 family transporter protein [Candidatus Peregrinibacteria bacterium]|nr:ABC-2 family transporter protein [Candidatus Peregrinibacteria bacterium]